MPEFKRQEQRLKNRKKKGWAKPDKSLSKREQEKLERRKKRENLHKEYKKYPTEKKDFYGIFVLPNKQVPIESIVGENEIYLDPIRGQTECFMWYEKVENVSGKKLAMTTHYFGKILFLALSSI